MLWWEKNGEAILAGGEPLVDRQYAGGKEALRPIYDRLVAAIDVLARMSSPARAAPTSRSAGPKQFALVQPSTRTRVDLGLRLPGVAAGDRLLDAGSFGSGTITHKVGLSSPEQVDAEVEAWLRAAYDARG